MDGGLIVLKESITSTVMSFPVRAAVVTIIKITIFENYPGPAHSPPGFEPFTPWGEFTPFENHGSRGLSLAKSVLKRDI
jgi:hypothetical protein